MPRIIAAFGRLKLTSSAERPIHLLAVFIAVLHAFMAITAADKKSPTFDEPVHLTAGYTYWLKNDFRLDPENDNLSSRWAAIPLLVNHPALRLMHNPFWKQGAAGPLSQQFFYELGNDPELMLRQGRMMISVFGAALCLLIYRCSREFFGPIGGLFSETLAAFDPTMLAHGALVTSDMAATFLFIAAAWSVWQLFQKITPWRFAIAALSLSGLFLAKFSAPLIFPVIGILSMLRILSPEPMTWPDMSALWKQRDRRCEVTLERKWTRLYTIVALVAALSAAVVLVIWAAFSFRYSAWTDSKPPHANSSWHWDYLLQDRGVVENTIGFARAHHLLPEAYLYGLAYVHKHEDDRPAFLDNQWSLAGFRSFFPRAFLYKTPLPILGLLAIGFCAAVGRWNERRKLHLPPASENPGYIRLSPVWAVPLVYGVCAISSNLNIGHRHILPIYPALFIACGACAYFFWRKNQIIGAGAVALLLLWQIGESVAVRPDYLAYFNETVGGPAHGYEHLVDSSLDWGQDLPGLKTWLDRHRPIVRSKPLYLAYFGTGNARFCGIDAKSLPEKHVSGDGIFAPLTGGIYCISATILQHVYALEIGPWCTVYEERYQKSLSEMQRYHETASDPSQRAQLIANEGATLWARKIQAFERMRFARLCAYLRQREPLAQIGHSILVFDLQSEEVNRAIYGPPVELAEKIAVTGY